MNKFLSLFIPSTLKYKLFVTFLLIIILPFSILTYYGFKKIETLMYSKISEQAHYQLEKMNESLANLMGIALKTNILLEQDSMVKSILKKPERMSVLDNIYQMERKFTSIGNSFFPYDVQVYYTVLDFHGNVYTSYRPRVSLNYEQLTNETWYVDLMNRKESFYWIADDENYVSKDVSKSPFLMTYYSRLLDDNFKQFGVARISHDYTGWFKSLVNQSPIPHRYYLVNEQGTSLMKSNQDSQLSHSILERVLRHRGSGYFFDDSSSSIINYYYIDSADWFIINQVPSEFLFKEIKELERVFFISFALLTAAFIMATFFVSSRMTRPLSLLQSKMMQVAEDKFHIRLPEEKYTGEVLQLTQTFNRMVSDMQGLIQRLKTEERQKEASRFHMLLNQMNPHFLLNTLNTMKWIAMRNENEEIAEICISLGRLLEISLNTEIDLIHLEQELELVQAYVYIQEKRYGPKFEVSYNVNPELKYALVPKLSLQPLVENSIQHGISQLPGQGVIIVRVYKEHQQLIVEIEDNGIGFEESAKYRRSTVRKRPNIGLDNIRERIKLLFKENGNLTVVPLAQGTLVRYSIPLLLSEPYGEGGGVHVDRIAGRG